MPTITNYCLFFYYTEHTLVESHQIGLSEGDAELASQFPKILNENEAAISSAFDETEITAAWTDGEQRELLLARNEVMALVMNSASTSGRSLMI